jgi:DNA helicase HerA-like ATPase
MRVSLGTLERNSQEEIELDEAARMRHFTVLGNSGVSKTTLLRNMVISDLESVRPEERHLAVESLISIVKHTFPDPGPEIRILFWNMQSWPFWRVRTPSTHGFRSIRRPIGEGAQ